MSSGPTDLIVYTDGACSGNPGPGGWGALLVRGTDRREIGGREVPTTNNRMEMRAAIEGLRFARPGERVHVVTDSKYLHDGISQWIHGWKRRGWKKSDGGEVLNRDLWEELDALVRRPGIRVTWEHVRGHAGHVMNERCDAIATAFARGEQPELEGTGTSWAAAPVPQPPPAADAPEPAAAQLWTGLLPEPVAYPAYLSYVGGRLEVHRTWAECERRVHQVSGARHKRVRTKREYRQTLAEWGAHG